MSRTAEALSPDLFSLPAYRNRDPETSVIAALSNPSGRAIDARRVLECHHDRPEGLTDFELAALVERKQTSAGKRRGELRDKGLIEETTLRRPSDSGSPAVVWKITWLGLRIIELLELKRSQLNELSEAAE